MKRSLLRIGDPVIQISGDRRMVAEGETKKPYVGTIRKFIGDRALVEGMNEALVHRKTRMTKSGEIPGGKLVVSQPLAISKLRFFSEKVGSGVKLKRTTLENGRRIRSFFNKSNSSWENL
jgi:hypothetical protein